MSTTALLSRYADAAFWMARYMERAENLARILDVNETFVRDAEGGQNWQSILRLNDDEDRFLADYGETTGRNVLEFYVLDRDNPTSITSAIAMARENARTLRPLISTEMWSQLNVFHNWLRSLSPSDLTLPTVSRLCSQVKEACQTHAGIIEGTFYRDQGWYFYHLGKYLERADQTTRLLDIKYHILLPSAAAVGTPVDVAQWNALLRSVAGYHAFRRMQPHGLRPAHIVGFLLFDKEFPRSVSNCLLLVNDLLTRLKSRYHLRGGNKAMEQLDDLLAVLANQTSESIIASGLHEFLDWVQIRLGEVTADISDDFFGR